MLKLFRTSQGLLAESGETRHVLPEDMTLDRLLQQADFSKGISDAIDASSKPPNSVDVKSLLAPIQSQEVWAAGVTYLRSREARVQESQAGGTGEQRGGGGGGGDFYERVYGASRPELFFKATPHRVVGPGGTVRIRSDARWSVPEPELALLVNTRGRIVGYTIGNDMSSRDIEGENPLYLPQAKVYDGCCALGPAVLVLEEPIASSTEIAMIINRGGNAVFSGKTSLAQMKRRLEELVEYLFRDNSFPAGCYLLTGTGVVPPESFTLQAGDEVAITIEPIGTLTNVVG